MSHRPQCLCRDCPCGVCGQCSRDHWAIDYKQAGQSGIGRGGGAGIEYGIEVVKSACSANRAQRDLSRKLDQLISERESWMSHREVLVDVVGVRTAGELVLEQVGQVSKHVPVFVNVGIEQKHGLSLRISSFC